MNVTVIGLGAMGGGMARSIIRSPDVAEVSGFDLSPTLVSTFYSEAKAANKASSEHPPQPPFRLKDFVTRQTDVVVLVLVNEHQCNTVCFGGSEGAGAGAGAGAGVGAGEGEGEGEGEGGEKENLLHLMKPNGCVLLCSTVTPAFAKSAHAKLSKKQIQFVDCPMSGGPARAQRGELTMMVASSEQRSLDYVDPLLKAMGKEIHVIPGGAGMGSTVKMVHQLLAGVHIVVAAEALALAAKAGVDVQQMYDIVKGAAGSSWMFCDRGKRMFDNENDQVMSALGIFIKDLDIVYSESKRLQCPTPIASAALQQFISGASMGLTRKDDSQVVKVYETLTGVPLVKKTMKRGLDAKEQDIVEMSSKSSKKEGDEVGDLWDGEEILEVASEPRHKMVLSNEYTRVLKVQFPPNDTTLAHRHAEDSLYFFLVEDGLNVINHVKGFDPQCDCMEFGEVRFGTHKSDKPLVHKITNKTDKLMFCIDAEVIKSPPVTCPLPLVAEYHSLIKKRHKCRVYKLELEPNQSVKVTYPFFYLTIVLKGSKIGMKIGNNGHGISWEKDIQLGDLEWHNPTIDITITNKGPEKFEQYIAEWC